MSATTGSTMSAQLDPRSRVLRRLIVDALEGGGRGHVGPALSLVEILRVLYDDILRYRPTEPRWQERDRLILSKGHGCLALYALLADKGFFPVSELRRQCRAEALLGGHPEITIPGVEASTGALGHGLAIGVGMALAARLHKRPSRVYVILGDGEMNEGSVWEALLMAAKHRLAHLTVIIDANGLQSWGPVEQICPLEPLAGKAAAFGCATTELDGHDVTTLRSTLAAPPDRDGRPHVVIARTIKGKGLPMAENNPAWHHLNRIDAKMVAEMRAALNG